MACVSLYDSIKMGLQFPWEGLLEREAMVLLDVDPEVKAFHAQPETMTWRHDGRARRYTPDLLIEYVDSSKVYVEVKPLDKVDVGMDGRRPQIETECRDRGARFGIWTGHHIRGGHRLSGAKRVVAGYAYLAGASGPRLRAAVEAAIAQIGLPTSLGALIVAAGVGRVAEGAILGLVAIGKLHVDLDLELSDASIIGRPRGVVASRALAGGRTWL